MGGREATYPEVDFLLPKETEPPSFIPAVSYKFISKSN
jgi:hypothetical protein